MLRLDRALGERIYIGDDIVITVMRIQREQVRIGIRAPKDVVISRLTQPMSNKVLTPDNQQ